MLGSVFVSGKFICKAHYHTILLIDMNGFPPPYVWTTKNRRTTLSVCSQDFFLFFFFFRMLKFVNICI